MRIFNDVKLPLAVVGRDVKTLPDLPDLIHTDSGLVSIGDPQDIGGNIFQDPAAVGTDTAGKRPILRRDRHTAK